eukprot:XP_014060733.1 PREDICTED: collagen alpha-1(XVI) chain-like [Salmo salar]
MFMGVNTTGPLEGRRSRADRIQTFLDSCNSTIVLLPIAPVPPRSGEGQLGLRGHPGPPRPLVQSTADRPTFVVSSGYPALETFLGLPALSGHPGAPGPAVSGSAGPITDTLAQVMLVSDDLSPRTMPQDYLV